jgi:outer membrane immunogenic protein
MKRNLFGAGLVSAILIAPFGIANAADLPVKAVPYVPVTAFSWTGFYVGTDVGGELANYGTRSPVACPPGGAGCYAPGILASINGQASQSIHPTAVVFGAKAGYNIQFGNVVAGVEGDFGSDNMRGVRQTYSSFPAPFAGVVPAPFYNNWLTTQWLATARGRLGFTTTPNNWLVYGTGGVAFTDEHYAHGFQEVSTPIAGFETSSSTKTLTGWVAGGGVEWEPAGAAWTFNAEYLYVQFPNLTTSGNVINTVTGATTANVFTSTSKLTEQIVRFGIAYHFGGPAPVGYATKY